MRFYGLVLGILGVWRITHLLHAEDGPWDVVVRLRGSVGDGFWGEVLDCFYCLSLWVAVPFALLLGETWTGRVLLWLAFSAGAILLERITNPGHGIPPAPFIEDEVEDDHVMLRQEEGFSGRKASGSSDE